MSLETQKGPFWISIFTIILSFSLHLRMSAVTSAVHAPFVSSPQIILSKCRIFLDDIMELVDDGLRVGIALHFCDGFWTIRTMFSSYVVLADVSVQGRIGFLIYASTKSVYSRAILVSAEKRWCRSLEWPHLVVTGVASIIIIDLRATGFYAY